MCFICGLPDTYRCDCEVNQPFCDQCGDDNQCREKIDAQCVFYHFNTTQPSRLTNLGIPNNTSLEVILEAIDDLIGSNFNIPFTPAESETISWETGGTAGHSPKAHVKISAESPNQAEIVEDGLLVKPHNPNYLVKVNATDAPDYLINQIEGGTDGIVSISKSVENGQVKLTPSINVLCLLKIIREQFPDEFCQLFADVCQRLEWIADELECVLDEIDLTDVNTGSDLPEPGYAFVDNGVVYFVSIANNTGHLWYIDPNTYATNADIVYVNETRSGQPYGPSGGTYVAGQPYRGNATSPITFPANTLNGYYDPNTRTLFIHGNRTYGCDWYDFNTNQWGKVTLGAGAAGSVYLTTVTTDPYTHTPLSSHPNTNYIITGWGTNSANGGTRVILIDKALREVYIERDVLASPIVGPSSNPFNRIWIAHLTNDNEIIVGKGQSTYRDVCVLDSSFNLIQELVLPVSNTGFNGQPTIYWQGLFHDRVNDKIYVNDYIGRVVMVYSKVGPNYTLTKTFNLDNNRIFPCARVNIQINPLTDEMFWDVNYGDSSAAYNPDGIDDALESERISYKINRVSLEIEKIFIGQEKAGANIVVLPSGDSMTYNQGNVNPNAPQTDGQFTLFNIGTGSINTGMVRVVTLKEVNAANGNTPTGNVKPNDPLDPDYIPDYQDNTLCPIEYSLACPNDVIFTATDESAYLEFGLNSDVVLNPALAKIRAVFDVGGVQKGLIEWNIPNTPNPNAFFGTVTLTGVNPGDTLDVSVIYLNVGDIPLVTCTDINSIVVPA